MVSIVNFDTENLTFSSDNVQDYAIYKSENYKVIKIDDKKQYIKRY